MDIYVQKHNEVYNRILCDPGIKEEMSEFFTFDVPNAKWSAKYKSRAWDGKIRLLNKMSGRIYSGLIDQVKEFAESREYEIEIEESLQEDDFSIEQAREFIATLNIPLEVRDYQLEGFVHAVRARRGVLVCPTGGGKSLMMYLLARWYNKKTLIIVPNIGLVHQFLAEIKGYGYTDDLHGVSVNERMDSTSNLVITTWQSLDARAPPEEWFSQFSVVLGDEVHQFKAKSLIKIMESFTSAEYKFGFTGSLDGLATNKMVIEGLFGACKTIATTHQLINENYLSKFKIKCVELKHPSAVCEARSKGKWDYKKEISYLIGNAGRNAFIRNLALNLEGNTLVLFQYVEKHGKELFNMIKDNSIKTYYVHGGVDGEKGTDNNSGILI